MEEDASYKPGVTLYFNMEKAAKDGLIVRDGCHLKVKDSLPLDIYQIWAADRKSAGLSGEYSTPAEFTYKANKLFNEIYGERVFEWED